MIIDLQTSKTLGSIGALLLFISIFTFVIPIPYIFTIIFIVGTALTLVSLYGLSGYYNESTIFKKTSIGIAAGIIGIALAAIIAYTLILPNIIDMMQQIYPSWDGNINTLPGIAADPNMSIDTSQIIESATAMLTNTLIMLAVLCIFTIIATYFIRQSLKQLSEKSNIGLFGAAGTVMFIGGFLTLLIIGYFLIWIATLLLAIAFIQLKHQQPTTNTYTTDQPPTPTTT
ncbi:MAG: DUF996 domain-containing protein [Nitrososphaerota archaeon]|jgi:uncharacterized membrane protein|nr:DUF996 domain-containing protein [Nitrososphaerota archaeon]